jgi:eukaryotic translation initiation factor 2C
MDKNYCKYTARLLAQRQPKGESLEQIHDLRLPVQELLQTYYKLNKKLPNHLLFFRDGVSEGQFKNVI